LLIWTTICALVGVMIIVLIACCCYWEHKKKQEALAGMGREFEVSNATLDTKPDILAIGKRSDPIAIEP
jgi:hypothetical protein